MIDLRSDTVTKPCQKMRKVIHDAEVGDDVFGDDPSVNRLQELSAEMMGKEAALFTPSGTQANLIAMLSQCERGDEYLVGQQAHTYKYEAGGAAVLGSIQPQPIDVENDGTLSLEKVAKHIKPDDPHFAKTKLLSLENTIGGKVLPLNYLSEAREFCKKHGLLLHLDAARGFNAAVALGVEMKEIARHFDTVSICLSKGLGTPMGSLLLGDKETIKRAVRWRKMLGGGMRQAGIVAAAGIYALENNIERLKDDHDNALHFANSLKHIDALNIDMDEVQTNMVFVDAPPQGADAIKEFLEKKNIKISANIRIRLTFHLNISRDDTNNLVSAFEEFYSK